jgi:hypothetical protein
LGWRPLSPGAGMLLPVVLFRGPPVGDCGYVVGGVCAIDAEDSIITPVTAPSVLKIITSPCWILCHLETELRWSCSLQRGGLTKSKISLYRSTKPREVARQSDGQDLVSRSQRRFMRTVITVSEIDRARCRLTQLKQQHLTNRGLKKEPSAVYVGLAALDYPSVAPIHAKRQRRSRKH